MLSSKQKMERNISKEVLKWYKNNARVFPWRLQKKNPYFTWISEIMLQQTTTKTVIPYFTRFIAKWPTIQSLANVDINQVFKEWEGLGYYRRASHLHQTARICHKTNLPNDLKSLMSLPGIGLYTANAILAIGFEKPAVVMDVNIERVFSRLFAISTPFPNAKKIIYQYIADSLPDKKFGAYAQGLMDIGSVICKPKNPQCFCCPLQLLCSGKENAMLFPVKPKKKPVELRHGFALVISNNNELLLGKRPLNGLLGGLFSIPTSFTKKFQNNKLIPFSKKIGVITHTFTHFKLQLEIFQTTYPDTFNIIQYISNDHLFDMHDQYLWVNKKHLQSYAFPAVIAKILKKL